MERWQRELADSIVSPAQIAGRFHVDSAALQAVADRFPMRITPYYAGLIREPGDPIWQQCVPDLRELADDQEGDPLNEQGLSPVPGLIHRYPDRVVWLVSLQCAVYCRFCMRKGRVGCAAGRCGDDGHEEALAYIAGDPAIRDVILSGGDPLLLNDESLEHLLAGLRRIPHVEIIRIGTRVPVTLPTRITAKLCRLLKQYHPLYLNTHFNHPREITPHSAGACARLADAGIPLGNQTVLLHGVNDDPAVMKRLVQQLLAIRVRPYYLHQMDLVNGTRHFRTPVARGVEIMASLRGHTSGLASPCFVVDLPGGKGKVPVLPEYLLREEERLVFRTYRGEEIDYYDV